MSLNCVDSTFPVKSTCVASLVASLTLIIYDVILSVVDKPAMSTPLWPLYRNLLHSPESQGLRELRSLVCQK